MTVTMTGMLPKSDESNGLNALADDILKDPEQTIVAVVVLDVPKITQNVDTNEVIPTLRIRRIEPVVDVQDKNRLGHLASRAFERRTGATVLPLDMEDEMRSVFGDGTAEDGDDAA